MAREPVEVEIAKAATKIVVEGLCEVAEKIAGLPETKNTTGDEALRTFVGVVRREWLDKPQDAA